MRRWRRQVEAGDRGGSLVELDDGEENKVVVTVLNRAIALLLTPTEEMRRLHRFFLVIEEELG